MLKAQGHTYRVLSAAFHTAPEAAAASCCDNKTAPPRLGAAEKPRAHAQQCLVRSRFCRERDLKNLLFGEKIQKTATLLAYPHIASRSLPV
jgi:hypothetical protein